MNLKFSSQLFARFGDIQQRLTFSFFISSMQWSDDGEKIMFVVRTLQTAVRIDGLVGKVGVLLSRKYVSFFFAFHPTKTD